MVPGELSCHYETNLASPPFQTHENPENPGMYFTVYILFYNNKKKSDVSY